MQGGHFGGTNCTYEGNVPNMDEAIFLARVVALDASNLRRAQIPESIRLRFTTEPYPNEATKRGLCALYRSHR